jgi:serine/threonine protein kinase
MKNDYQIPVNSLDIESFKEIPRKYKDDENELESFIDFLKGLFVLDPQHRWNAKMALKHPFITREKYQNKFIPYRQDVSIMNTSIEASLFSDNHRSYNSLAVDYNYNNNDYFNQSCGSFQDQNSMTKYDYQEIPLGNLNAKILRNPVPQAKLINFNNPKIIKNKFDNPGHNSFMMTSFDKLSYNNSFTGDHQNHNFYYGANKNQASKKKKKKSLKQYKNKFDTKMINFLQPYSHKKTSNESK